MMETLATNTKLALASLAVVVVLVTAIAAGALDRFASDGEVEWRSAIGALIAYWCLLFTAVWLVPLAVRHSKQVGLTLVSTGISLGGIELVARYAVPGADVVSYDAGGFRSRDLHHIYPPYERRYLGRFEGTPVFLETNEDGLRTRYSREEFTRHAERAIFLGDSFTFGLGVSSGDAFPALVERRLRERHGAGDVAVLNAGIVSYSPFLAKLLLEKRLAAYRPTLVVYFLDTTDIGDDYAYMALADQSAGTTTFPFDDGAAVTYRGALNELTRPYRRRLMGALGYPVRLIRAWSGYPNRAPMPEDYYDFEISIGDVRERNRFFIYRHPLDDTRHVFDLAMGNVDAMARLSADMGARFALIVTPRFHHWNVEESPDNWENEEYGLAEPYQFEYFRYFEESRRNYPIISLLPDFQASDSFPLVFAADPHWNAAGHAFVADAVVRHLLSRKLIGDRTPASRHPLPPAGGRSVPSADDRAER